ncbi:cell envelope biogenesis protein OmpA [Alteromonas sp. KUL156]|nr:cell envelope biogenesis protein OmpA [Alteromonas sp. KUL154]GFE01381.1 cell envelope biogenesis protein OmpA [Alteromonas sp. KUL156]
MKKAIHFLLIIVFIPITINSQRKYAANRYFEEFSYKKSAELYQSIYNKGDNSYTVLSRLGDSYYFNFKYVMAEKNYQELMKLYENSAKPKHIFRYAQVLKTNGKIKESDKWLLKLNKNDSRVKALEENTNYFVEYSNREKTYINIHNLSSNTSYSDFGGYIYDNHLYFSSTQPKTEKGKKLYRWNKQPYLNIYKAKQNNDFIKVLDVGKPIILEELSSKYHESNIVVSKDGKTAYFTRDNFDGKRLIGDKNNISHLKIYKATKKGNFWGDIKELPFNSNSFSCGHPALSPDEKTLYFVSDMPNGYGDTDIYKIAILENDIYGKPENLGKTINTESKEMFPFIGNDNVLYFSSDGHIGLGGLDVFEAKITSNSYTKPVNLGSPVNGPFDDFSFIINDKHTQGYFSSNRKEGKGDDDIYSFKIYDCKENIKGVISDSKTGNPIPNATVQLINKQGEPIFTKTTNKDGSYLFEKIDCEKNFVVVASKKDYRNSQKNTKTLNINKRLITENIQLESLIKDDQIIINPIYFDFDLYNIREDAEYELEHIVSVLKDNPDISLRIESHTDSRGSRTYNKLLSDKRAKSTRDYILSRGISPKRIKSAVGYGEEQLLNKCNDLNQKKCTEQEHQQNRRSYFYIEKK